MSATMEASANDLALAGNYFTEPLYLQARPEEGILRNRGGARIVGLTDDLLTSIHNSISEFAGRDAPSLLRAIGRRWGQRASTMFAQEMHAFYHKPISDLPLGMASSALAEALRSHGWGELQIDFSRYAEGFVVVTLENPVLGSDVKPNGDRIEHLTAGFLAGFFSNWSGVELGCAQTSGPGVGASSSSFVLTLPERLSAVADLLDAGRPHGEVISKLRETRAT